MKVTKVIILKILLLIVMVLSGTAIMKILDLLFKIGYENIWEVGYKVGVIGWISSLVVPFIVERKNKTRIKRRTSMKSKLSFISSVVQLVFGILAIVAFIILLINREDISRWILTLLLAIALVITGIIGIIDYKRKR